MYVIIIAAYLYEFNLIFYCYFEAIDNNLLLTSSENILRQYLQNKLSKYNNTLTLWDFYIASAIYQNSEIFLRRRDKPTGIL